MLFNSYIFIFIFLPLTLLGYFLLNHFERYNLAKIFLIGMSLLFYGYFKVYYLLIIVSSVVVNYLFSFILSKFEEKYSYIGVNIRRLFLIIGVILNLGLLIHFKYLDFIIENLNALGTDFRIRNIILPLGISFFSFQQLSYVVDRATGKAKHYNIIDYAAFVTFFPQLVAGPIVMYDSLIPQFEDESNKSFDSDNFSQGICRFTLGLAKKVLLADVLANIVNFGYDQILFMDSVSSLLVSFAFTLQLYFDFSGYSDMALGLGKMFNIELPQNFDSPYKACSMKELWQRWHITLSGFFLRYVYIPMGGSRKGKVRTQINVFVVFLLSGIWHGANWTFVVWGILQGIAVIYDNLGLIGVEVPFHKINYRLRIPHWLGVVFTFLYYNFTCIFFRSESISQANQMIKNIFSFKYTGYFPKLAESFSLSELYPVSKLIDMKFQSFNSVFNIIVILLFMLVCFFILSRRNTQQICEDSLTKSRAFGTAFLFVWCIISFSMVSTFIYFNF